MKTLLKSLAVLALSLIVVLGALLLWLDPNVFKPRIEQLARQQGVALRIEGDLGWRFWPALGIEINDVSVAATAEPETPLARLDSASLLVQTAPLWRGELMVEHLVVSGAEVTLKVDDKGRGNWEALKSESQQAAPEPAAAEETGPARSLELAVKQLSLSHINVSYRDARTGRELDAELQALGVTDFNLDDRPFELTSEWRLALKQTGAPDQSVALEGRLGAKARLDAALTHLRLTDGTLALSVSGPRQTERLSGEFALALNQLGSEPVYSASLNLDSFNPKKLLASLGLAVPETADPKALTALGVSGEFSGSTQSVSLAPLSLTLDDTRIDGEVLVTDLQSQALEATLAADAIDADRYLPPEPDAAPTGEDTTAADEPLIPLEAVRALNARVNLDLGELKVAGLTARDIRLRLKARDGLVQLTEASLHAYDGRTLAQATLDGRGETADIDFNAEVAAIKLAPLLRDLALDENLQLTGALNLNASGRTRGVMADALFDALAIDADFNGAEMTVAPLNVEAYFCRAVALTRQSSQQSADAERSWPEYTDLRELGGQLRLRDRVVTITDFSAGVGQLTLGVRGQVNLARGRFDLRLPLTLQGERTSEDGCSVQSNYWVNRSLSLLGCSGTFESLAPAKDCGLAPKALQSLAGDYTKYRLQRELSRQLTPDEDDGDERDATKDAVRGLFNRFLNTDKE